MKNDNNYEMTDVMQKMKMLTITKYEDDKMIDYATAEFDYSNEHEEDDKNDEADETDNIKKNGEHYNNDQDAEHD